MQQCEGPLICGHCDQQVGTHCEADQTPEIIFINLPSDDIVIVNGVCVMTHDHALAGAPDTSGQALAENLARVFGGTPEEVEFPNPVDLLGEYWTYDEVVKRVLEQRNASNES